MRRARHMFVAVAAVAALAGGQLAAGASPSVVPAVGNPGIARLNADATGALTLSRSSSGTLTFVGAGAGRVVNPGVTSDMSAVAAAKAHLARYGGALAVSSDSALTAQGPGVRTPDGQQVVRFDQRIGGLPVIAGQVAVSVGADRQLRSLSATVSKSRAVPVAKVSQSGAAAAIRDSAAKMKLPQGVTISGAGRWVFDPAVIGASKAPFGARGVWRFEVTRGNAFHRLVLVDDQSAKVLLNIDQIEQAGRVVCDDNNVVQAVEEEPCTSGFARQEGDAPTGIADVDKAYDYAGEVSTFYNQVAGVDLANVIGINVGGQNRLAATVRYCPDAANCPYENAFWNGSQMFYGEGFAVADDVVGHEMTHGVTDRNSSLFYFGQSGAMNESMSDVMGEIIDHRNGADDDSQWKLAEDISGGPIRDMKDPTSLGDPDRTSSPNWWNDWDPFYWAFYGPYPDNGGVHFNSGVGNKTAYLISQGGTFNGQTVTGIDAADTTLNKTALLYYNAIVSLVSGSDYANLADVLEQGCASFVAAGTGGFTSADCTSIHQAVTATELRTTPVNAPQPADAQKACPAGTTLRELFNSETGTPASKFTTDGTGLWSYGVDPYWGSNATSGHDSWYGANPDGTPSSSSMTSASAISLPAGQQSFLWFNQWRIFEWYPAGYADATSNSYEVDGGTVSVDDTGDATPAVDASGLPWVNGPSQTLHPFPGETNPYTGTKAFAGDSAGWIASRADLSSFAGKNVKVSFNSLGADIYTFIGWWLDDISVYTCDVAPVTPPPTPTPQPTSATALKAKGKVEKAVVKWDAPATNPSKVTGYRVSTTGKSVTVAASAHKAVIKGLKQGKTYTFRVEALGANGFVAPAAKVKAKGTEVTLKVEEANGKTSLKGKLLKGSKGLKNQVLKVLTKQGNKWVKVDTVSTGKDGKYSLTIGGLSTKKYLVMFKGALGLMGSESPAKHL